MGQRPSPHTVVLPPRGEAQRRPWYRRLFASPRYVVLLVAGLLIVGGGAAFGVTQLLGPDEPATTQGGSPGAEGAGKGKGGRAASVDPASVTVSVLNGTRIPGLAAQVGDKIEGEGFQLGNVTNSSDQQRAESAVLFAPGAEREAIAVGRRLDIAQREPVDPESQALGGDATVVVVVGADQTQ